MGRKILYVLLAIVLILVVVSLFMPNQFYSERTVTIKAPVSVVYNQINNLKNRESWDPWKKMDATLKITYNQIPSGEGASYSWIGESKYTGKGKITITKSVVNELVVSDLEFGGRTGAVSGFKLQPEGDSTKVIWYFENDLGWNPMAKYMSQLMGGMMSDMFDSGLQDLKKVCESMPIEPTAN